MKIKINLLAIAIVLALIVFGISTYFQKKLIKYEATIPCYVLTRDINENEKIEESDVKIVNIPISLVATQKIVTSFNEIKGLYAKDNVKSGQIVMKSQFDTKEALSIYEADEGKEKVSIKIKAAENGMSYQIKEKSRVNIDVTMRNEFAKDFLLEKGRIVIGDEYDGYTVIQLLNDVEVLGVFTIDGVEYEKSDGENIDSILIAVSPDEARQINLLREIASFNITGISNNRSAEDESQVEDDQVEEIEEINEVQISVSGDE